KLNKEYGIAIPNMSFLVGKLESGETAMYTVIDMIHGKSLSETEKFPDEAEATLDTFYANMARYYADAYRTGGDYWWDFHNDQFVMGHKKGETKDQVYLVDVEPRMYKRDYKDQQPKTDALRRLRQVFEYAEESEKKFSKPVRFILTRDTLKNALKNVREEDKDSLVVEAFRRRL
ncbi:MAG: hypothetical protein HYW88_02875, partial [Candidatus Sungbacteria bacterium]|nr:hypothetical protein [Candidatus Sungbacteria bacterium]